MGFSSQPGIVFRALVFATVCASAVFVTDGAAEVADATDQQSDIARDGDIGIVVDQAVLFMEGFDKGVNVIFPDYWYTARRMQASSGTYLAQVNLPDDELRFDAVFIPSMSGRGEVYWDGERLGGTLPLLGTGIPTIAGPLLVSIPKALATPGDHVLEVNFAGPPSQLGYVLSPVITTRTLSEGVFVRKKFTLVYLPVAFGVISIVVALVFYAAYRNDSVGRGLGWLAAGLLGLSFSMLGLYFPPSEEWASLFYRTRLALFHFSFIFFLFAVHAVREQAPGKISNAILVIGILMTLAVFVAPEERIYRMGVLWVGLSYAIGIYLLISVIRIALEPPRRWVSLLPIAVVPVFVIHDWVGILNGGEFWADQALSIYNSALFACAIMIVMVVRARQNARDLIALNQNLEQRVAEKQAELQSNYAQVAEADRREAVNIERQRMVREMHDGLGGQLVSTLALVESGQFSSDEIESALRDSLDDLRIMVHSMDHDIDSLGELLALIRERSEPRLLRQGIALKWSVDDLKCGDKLTQHQAGHVLRILQETLSNITRHANASGIALHASVEDGQVQIIVEDNGCGLSGSDNAELLGGSGLINMQARAEQIHGTVKVEEYEAERDSGGVSGTRVTLTFPIGSTSL